MEMTGPTTGSGLPVILGSFRFDYEYEIEYEYDFRISNQ